MYSFALVSLVRAFFGNKFIRVTPSVSPSNSNTQTTNTHKGGKAIDQTSSRTHIPQEEELTYRCNREKIKNMITISLVRRTVSVNGLTGRGVKVLAAGLINRDWMDRFRSFFNAVTERRVKYYRRSLDRYLAARCPQSAVSHPQLDYLHGVPIYFSSN